MNDKLEEAARLPEKYRGCTPWPWKSSGTLVYASGIDVGAEKSGTICACGEPRKSKYVEYIPVDCSSAFLDEAFANAHLIADAPALAIRVQELEAALREVCGITDNQEDVAVQRARVILAKVVK